MARTSRTTPDPARPVSTVAQLPTRDRYEVVIVGAGIAGASLAYFLAEHGWSDVLVIEREDVKELEISLGCNLDWQRGRGL
mgnify:CR=1 FL=1